MLFEEIVYGPIHSRRLGISLGVNLMPRHEKRCSFNCVYCECGWNVAPTEKNILPRREEVAEALEQKLLALREEHVCPDVITFSGNGEPTLHPDFAAIIDDTIRLRDRYCPEAKISVLSNSTRLGNESVREALLRCDNRILKLDSAITATMQRIDQPVDMRLTSEAIEQLLARFEGRFTLQTCFLTGEGIDNTTEAEVSAWQNAVRRLRPEHVMIYVIDRQTPDTTLRKVSPERMQQIAAPLRSEGFDVQVSC